MSLRLFVSRCAARAATPTARARPLALAALANACASPAAAAVLSAHVPVRHFAKAAKKGKGGKAAAAPVSARSDDDDDSGADGDALSLDKTKKSMTGAVLNFTRQLNQMRPGKADAGIFDDLNVQAYGQYVALSQLAQVAVSGTHSLSVTVYDPSLLQDIRKAIEAMNPVYSVREDGMNLEISFPKMSKETRMELQKAVKKQAEQARQHVRRVRQDAMNHAKKLKDEISEDDVKKHTEQIQKLTDDAVNEIAKLLAAKEKDLVAV